MAECDRHPTYKHKPSGSSLLSEFNQNVNIQEELVWGLSYRHLKQQQANVPMPTKHSPIDIPFQICREKQRKAKQHKKEAKGEKNKREAKDEKPSLLERSVMSQRKYMDYLSIPKKRKVQKPKKKKKCRCYIEPCPPRLAQLALPKKWRVYNNWKDYQHCLSTPMILTLQQILHTDKNLEPKEARYYYKQLDKKRWKLRRARRRLRMKAKAEKEKGENLWVMKEITETTTTLIEYLQQEPLFSLTYKQLLLSDGILEYLEMCRVMQKPKRTTNNDFEKTIIEVCDKIAVWMDTLTRFVDLQAFDSAEDIPPLTISSMEGEEGESTIYSEDKYGLWGPGGLLFGEEGEGSEFGGLGRGRSPSEAERMLAGLFRPQEGEGESDLEAFLDDLDLDLLDKLIRILSNCSDEFLEGMVDEEKMPGVRYIDVLNRVKELRDGILSKGRQKPFLEELMLSWAIKNEPDEIDDKMKNKIQETAALLGDFMFGIKGARGGFPTIDEGEGEGEGEGGLGDDLGGGRGGVGGRGGRGGLGEDEEGEGILEEAYIKKRAAMLGEKGEGDYGEGEDDTLRAGLLDADKLEAEGGDTTTMLDMTLSEREREEALLAGYGGEGYDEGMLQLGEEGGEVSVLYGPGLEGRIIKGHKPSVILEHRPDMVCCLSLKIWSVWLLDITHNAHNWTKWLHCVIQKVREFAAVVRGDVLLPNGEKKILYKEDWRQFAKETEEMIAAWRQYSAHVKELSDNIIENFHGKKVLNCCPKCLQDHLIKDVVTAHETLKALTEAINCATYWQKCLDELVQKTCPVTGAEFAEELESSSTSSEESDVSEPCICAKGKRKSKDDEDESSESVYEIEELDVADTQGQGGAGPSQKGWGPNRGRGGPGSGAGGTRPSTGGPGGVCRPNTRR